MNGDDNCICILLGIICGSIIIIFIIGAIADNHETNSLIQAGLRQTVVKVNGRDRVIWDKPSK